MTHPRAGTRRLPRLAALLGATLVLGPLTATAPASASGPAMAPDSVTQIPDPGVTLAVPADGRINGYHFAGKVLGVATGTSMPSPNGARAGAGQRLWVFGLRWFADQILDDTGQPTGVAQVTATLIYNGARLTVPITQPPQPSSGTQPVDSGTEYFLASLPSNTSDAQLELANGGFAQDFSLTHMARTGTQPAVLYRDPNSWQVTQPLTLSKSLPTPYTQSANVDTSNLLTASITVQLDQVTLSYFAPDGPTDTSADPGQAWLIPDLHDPVPRFNSAFQNLNYTTHAQASGITLTLPDGTVITAKAFPGAGNDYPTYSGQDNNSVFPDGFAFLVPAGFTVGTITVALPPEVAIPDFSFGAPSQTYNLPAVHFAFTVPAAQPISRATGAAIRPAAIRAVASVNTASRKSSTSWALPAILVLLGAAATAGATIPRRLRHRRRNAQQTTDDDSPPTDPLPPQSPTFEPAVNRPAPRVGSAETAPAPVGTATLAQPTETGHGFATGEADPAGRPGSPETELSFGERAVGAIDLIRSDPLQAFIPPVPPPLQEPAVLVFDRMRIVGWAQPPDRNPVIDVVCYLATHQDRPVSTETLQAALGSETADPDRQTLRSNISRARRALGEGHLPEATPDGYQLQGVTCDLAVLETLTARAAAAEREGDRAQAIELFSQAVALIAGKPFESARNYPWVDLENLRTHAEQAATKAAHELARLALADKRPELALWAARQGMGANPLDQTLAAPALMAAKRAGRSAALRAEWTSISRVLKANGLDPDPELVELHHRLLEQADD